MLLRLGQESGKYGLFNNHSYRIKIMYWKETDTSNFSFENVNGGKGIIQAHKFFTEHSQTGFQFHVWELLPGDSEGIHTHDKKYDYEEIYYIIDGKGIMTINNEEVTIQSLLTKFTSPFNLSGLPAISVPCGFDTVGLPIGLQIVGKHFDEMTILQIAHIFESNTEWHTIKPSL